MFRYHNAHALYTDTETDSKAQTTYHENSPTLHCQRNVRSTISFVTVATVHTALIILYSTKLKPPGAMRLRPRGHDFELPTVKFEFNERNFIVRSLFQYV